MTITSYLLRRTRPAQFRGADDDETIVEYYFNDERTPIYWTGSFDLAERYFDLEEAQKARDSYLRYSSDQIDKSATFEIVEVTISLGEVVD